MDIEKPKTIEALRAEKLAELYQKLNMLEFEKLGKISDYVDRLREEENLEKPN